MLSSLTERDLMKQQGGPNPNGIICTPRWKPKWTYFIYTDLFLKTRIKLFNHKDQGRDKSPNAKNNKRCNTRIEWVDKSDV